MSLRRTASGLASLHLFFQADVVVFCEGGISIPEVDVTQGMGEEGTLDCLFWRRIADFIGAKRRYHFKSVGSKSVLRTIAADIRNRDIPTIVICLDRDYDWHCNCKIDDERVVYSYGYSWESDVVCYCGLERVLFNFVARTIENETLFCDVKNAIHLFGTQVSKWCESEIALAFRQKGSVFPRSKPLAMINLDGDVPVLDHLRLRGQLQLLGYVRRPHAIVAIPKTEGLRHIWGRLLSSYVYHLIGRLLDKQNPRIKISYDVFMRLLMTEMIRSMHEGLLGDLESYYKSMANVFH
jgi:hypothetical protein